MPVPCCSKSAENTLGFVGADELGVSVQLAPKSTCHCSLDNLDFKIPKYFQRAPT